jgi:hypothetical protein
VLEGYTELVEDYHVKQGWDAPKWPLGGKRRIKLKKKLKKINKKMSFDSPPNSVC